MSRLHHAWPRLVAMVVVGVAVATAAGALVSWAIAPVSGWAAASLTYVLWVWSRVRGLDSAQTRDHALIEDPGRRVTESLILVANLISLSAVALLIVQGHGADAGRARWYGALGMLGVALSWVLIHTLFTLRYASEYHRDGDGGIDFNSDETPRYADFAYVAFTVGMTYQIADTDVTSSRIRSTVLRHATLSYVFGTVIVVTAINLALSLAA